MFEKYLRDVHAKQYTGLDDDMPDNFDTWLESLESAEVMEYQRSFYQIILKNRYGNKNTNNRRSKRDKRTC
jgi:hypothetical protein